MKTFDYLPCLLTIIFSARSHESLLRSLAHGVGLRKANRGASVRTRKSRGMSDDVKDYSETNETVGRSEDPGARRHGNFMNYYQFHPAEERARQLPRDVWRRPTHPDRKYVGLDVGCNAGNLTLVLADILQQEMSDKVEVHLLGVDLDPILIERARESNKVPDRVSYECLDFMSKDREETLKKYLEKFGRKRFDVAFCFSITMWIHLNYGDAGLVDYLEAICAASKMLVIEPQPWKCYRNASRRMRRAGAGDFALLDSLKMNGDVASHIEKIVIDRCSFRPVTVTGENDWGRKILVYERTGNDDLS